MKKRFSPQKKEDNVKRQEPKFFVGIGASAGGLEALRSFFGEVKSANGMAFIVVQHLAPLYQSRLVELISHTTKLPVKEAKNGEVIGAGTIYITPPNRDILIERGKIILKQPSMKVGPKPSINRFFKSLAESVGNKAIAIVLSGTGTDGSLGIRSIKSAGGVTIVQTPASAKYDGMPKASKLTGIIDFELTPQAMAEKLAHFPDAITTPARAEGIKIDADPYIGVLDILHDQVGANFSQYKMSTVHRRIDRRVAATGSSSVTEYLKLIKKQPPEVNILFQDLLISVTTFFRDPQAFAALEKSVMRRLKAKAAGNNFRCWVIGCATGEEAYTMAIILNELCERLKKDLRIQVFATDIDERALKTAQRASYPKNIFEAVPARLKTKYFTEKGDRLQVKPLMRDVVVFARHNINQDPPFLNLDLATCRNVLIYFTGELQRIVFKTLHYSLVKDGLLFLGKSESVPADLDFFMLQDKNAKIYSRIEGKAALPQRAAVKGRADLTKKENNDAEFESVDENLYATMVKNFAPDSVIIDSDNQIRQFYGNVGQYLRLVPGRPQYNIVKFLPKDIGFELSALLNQSNRDQTLSRGREHLFKVMNEEKWVRLTVAPLSTQVPKTFLISFDSRPVEKTHRPPSKIDSNSVTLAEQYEGCQEELKAAQEHLQTVIEEQETSNEELQSLNEELQSSNEELQSTNEELETANEEMQSTNEELTTLNQELNVKSAEVIALNQTMQAVQNAIMYPLVILDKNLKILSFNPAARHLLRINDSDVGNSIKSIPTNFDIARLIEKIEMVMVTGTEGNVRLQEKGRSFEVQIQLYRGLRDIAQGAVVSFIDNTEITHSLEETTQIRQRLTSILDNTPSMVTMKDPLGVYIYANPKFEQLIKNASEGVVGSTDEELFGATMAEQLRARDFEVTNKKSAIQFEEKMEIGGKSYWWASARFPLLDHKRRVQSICTISLDITEQVVHRHQLELFKTGMSSATAGIIILDGRDKEYRTSFISEEVRENLLVNLVNLVGLSLRQTLAKIMPHKKMGFIELLAHQVQSSSSFVTTLDLDVTGKEARWMELRSNHLKFAQESDSHIIITIFDTTQKVLAQKTITQQQDELTKFGRYSALGEIAAGIAHEINTPLNVILTKTDFLRKVAQLDKIDKEKVTKSAGDIDQMAKTVANIVTGLKSLASRTSDEFERVSLQQLISDTLKVCEFRMSRFGIDLKLILPEKDIFAQCYPIQITQIIINLLNNSIEAIANSEERWIELSLKEKNEQVLVTVTDSGDGIAPDIAEKIMTPFFTTKKDQKGTGIGLSLSRTIARRHKGDLVLNQKSKKTSFSLEIPKMQN